MLKMIPMNELGFNAIFAMAAIALLTALALYWGYDGAIFLTSIGIISGLGGYPILNTIYKNSIQPMAKTIVKYSENER